MADGRRVLFLLPFPPRLDATHGGGRVMAHLIAGLAARHTVALLFLRAAGEPPLDPLLQGRCAWVEEVARPHGQGGLRQRLRLLGALLRGKPYWASDWTVADFARRLRARAQGWQPDIVQVEYHIMAQFLSALDGCAAPRVLTAHEPGFHAARDRLRGERGVAWLRQGCDALAWARFERAIARRVQAVVVFTERDQRALAPLAGATPLARIPLGTPLPAQPLDPLGASPPTLLFVGNFVHPPNVDAAMRLIGSIFPAARRRCPDARLQLVGERPPPSVQAGASAQVEVTGRVDDVAPFLDGAAIVVVPLRMGGGMRVKVLEALAAGKAIVASPRAVEGLAVRDGEQVLLAETDEQFCDAIVALLEEPSRRVALARRARAWACANLGWERPVAAYEALYDQLIDAQVPQRVPWPRATSPSSR